MGAKRQKCHRGAPNQSLSGNGGDTEERKEEAEREGCREVLAVAVSFQQSLRFLWLLTRAHVAAMV
jgi:hypothetical protein